MKRRMKRGLILLAIVLIAVSLVRGWVVMTGPQREDLNNKVDVKITVDPDKVKEDARQVKKSAEKLEEKVREEIEELRGTPKSGDPQTPEREPASPSTAPNSE